MSVEVAMLEGNLTEFMIGVNYWPRKKAMYWWKDFDENEVKEEFGQISDLNLKVVRIFLDWEKFQPKADEVSTDALQKLGLVLGIAEKHNLRVIVTFFCGYMSGINILPEWALDKRANFYRHKTISDGRLVIHPARDLFEDETMLGAQKLQIATVVRKFASREVIYAWDLCNEVENLHMPRSPEVARGWLSTLAEEIRKLDSLTPITCGFHAENLENEVINNRITDAAQIVDFLCMHGYPNYSTVVSDPIDADYVSFCSLLTQSLGGKPVLFEEFGIPTAPPGEGSGFIEAAQSTSGTTAPYFASEEVAADFYRRCLENLHKVGSLGALAWCFSDYDERVWSQPPFDTSIHERFFGITRADGCVKPMGKILANFRGRKVVKPPYPLTLTSKYYENPLANFKSLWASFKKRTEK